MNEENLQSKDEAIEEIARKINLVQLECLRYLKRRNLVYSDFYGGPNEVDRKILKELCELELIVKKRVPLASETIWEITFHGIAVLSLLSKNEEEERELEIKRFMEGKFRELNEDSGVS